jgi:hypothetical protein
MIHLGFAKQAARSLAKDFAAGVDPIGVVTYRYGAADARGKIEKSRRQKAIIAGTAGGLLGGGVAIPAITVGAVRAGQGFIKGKGNIGTRAVRGLRGFAEGAKEPFRQIVDTNRASMALRRVSKGGKAMGKPELGSVQRVVKDVNIKDLEEAAAATGSTPGKLLTLFRSGQVSRGTAKALSPSVTNSARSVNAAFGSSALISGGTATVGYVRGEGDETTFQARLREKVKEIKTK